MLIRHDYSSFPLHIPNMAFVVVDGFFHFAQQHGGGLQLMVIDHVEGLAAMGGTMGKEFFIHVEFVGNLHEAAHVG